ncbi:phage virion morphogenesis protein [Burkholderia ambifaria]|uniref:phage virion morphogenesis protein n=1 Tax=Burkholderia ambifaria TaxID=152480 RepID=UPI00158C09F3|nr:phage virion morphogenesis protein [Burkholderia ambifaria]
MTLGLQVDVRGIDAIRQEIGRIEARGHALEPVHRKIGALLESRIERRFDTKVDPLGSRWAPHRQTTIDRYKRQDGKGGRRGSLLQRSGMMRDSLSHAASNQGVMIGFGRPYALFHEYGTRRMIRRGILMADPLAGTLAESDIDAVLTLLLNHFSR